MHMHDVLYAIGGAITDAGPGEIQDNLKRALVEVEALYASGLVREVMVTGPDRKWWFAADLDPKRPCYVTRDLIGPLGGVKI